MKDGGSLEAIMNPLRDALLDKSFSIFFAKDLIISIGGRLDAKVHRHFAIQLAFGLDHPFQVKSPEGNWQTLPAAIIPSNCPHRYDGTVGTQFIMLINPLSRMGRFIRRQWITDDDIINLLPRESIAPLMDSLNKLCHAPQDIEVLQKILSFFSPPPEFCFEKKVLS